MNGEKVRDGCLEVIHQGQQRDSRRELGIFRWAQLRYWTLTFAEFGVVQVAVQVLNAVAGLLIVRSLSKQEYAFFAIANSMQTACNLLADVGIGIGVRSIGGKVCSDRFRFGQLINTALGLRRSFAFYSLGISLPIAGWMLWRNGAEPFYAVGLCVALGAGVIPLLGASVWGVSPGLHGQYRRIQKLELGNAALRLFFVGSLAFSWINACLTMVVGIVTNMVQAGVQRSWAKEKADFMAPSSADDHRELTRLSKKSFPNAVFFCFQGQLTLLIFTFGGSPTGIADLTALSRLAVLLTVFSVAFSNVLAPRFARCQDPARLTQLYLLLVGGTVMVMLPLFFFAWVFPDLFLWLLGSKYQWLKRECGWVVATACVGQIAGAMWNLNSSKAWIRAQGTGFIPSILGAQLLAALSLDLRQFHDVLIFNLATAGATIPVYALDAYWGLRAERRAVSKLMSHDFESVNTSQSSRPTLP